MQPWREAAGGPSQDEAGGRSAGAGVSPSLGLLRRPREPRTPGPTPEARTAFSGLFICPPRTSGIPTALITAVTLPAGDTLPCSTVSAQGRGGDETRPSLGELTLGGQAGE